MGNPELNLLSDQFSLTLGDHLSELSSSSVKCPLQFSFQQNNDI